MLTAPRWRVKIRNVGFKVEEEGGFYFVLPKGELLSGKGDGELKETLQRLITEGRSRIVVDLSDVPYIDSSILGLLVHSATQVRKNGGALKLLKPGKRILEVLEVTRLISVFEIADDRSAL